MANIKNLTAVAVSTAAFITLAGAAGMPQAFAATSPSTMNGKYAFRYDGDAHDWDTWVISTECTQSGQCTQHVQGQVMSRGYTAQLVNDKWTLSAHVSYGFICDADQKPYPGTVTFTYDSNGIGTDVSNPDPGHCEGSKTRTAAFHLHKVA